MSFVPEASPDPDALPAMVNDQLELHALTLNWINVYRLERGLPILAEIPEGGLNEACPGAHFHRYQAPGREYALTRDIAVGKAMMQAGASTVRDYRIASEPEAPMEWDVQIPVYLRDWIK